MDIYFNSNAEKIRHYTKELLKDKDKHSLKEIKYYVEKHTDERFSHGCYSGALRDLINKEKSFKRVERGYYKFSESPKKHFENRIDSILAETVVKINNELSDFNISDASERDLDIVREYKRIVDCIQKKIT